MNFDFGQTIEYIDGTRDLNFEAARKWAADHGTGFVEDVGARSKAGGVLRRYFKIGTEPAKPATPAPVELTDAEAQAMKRSARDAIMRLTQNRIDRYRNQTEAGIDPVDDASAYRRLLLYTQYLRDFTEPESWWTADILTFDEWSAGDE